MPQEEETSPDTAMYDTLDPTVSKPLDAAELGMTPSVEPETEQPHFDDRYKDDLTGMLYLGALKKRFEWLGHTFVVRTLSVGEIAEIAVVAARYRDTDFAAKAYQAATVAACLVTVDDRPLPVVPLTNEVDDTNISARFNYVMNRWFPPVIDYVFTQFYELEARARDLLDELGKASG